MQTNSFFLNLEISLFEQQHNAHRCQRIVLQRETCFMLTHPY
jgi:hypothetical protein